LETVERAEQLLLDERDAENLEFLEDAIERFPQDPEVRLLYGTAFSPISPGGGSLAVGHGHQAGYGQSLAADPGSLSIA